MSFQLTITPIKLKDIPSEEVLLTAGNDLLESTASWKQGKSYTKNNVKTLGRSKLPGDGANWHCRVSQHSKEEATFDEFWSKIAIDKANNETQFIPDITHATLIRKISPTQIVWTMHYSLPSPVSARIFTVLQVVHLSKTSPRSGIIVSIPIDVSDDDELTKLEGKGVKGRYVSVERLLELDNGMVEWRMATSSTPGGSIPQFLVESTMPNMISQDVPHFLEWLHKGRAQDSGTTPGKEPFSAHLPSVEENGNVAILGGAPMLQAGGGALPST